MRSAMRALALYWIVLPCQPLLAGNEASPRASLVEAANKLDSGRLTEIAVSMGSDLTKVVAAGVLASWRGETQKSSTLLEISRRHGALTCSLIDSLVLRYLAYDAADLGQYARAADFGSELLAKHDSTLTGNDAADFSSSVELWRILKSEKPMIVQNNGVALLPLISNSAGRIEATIMIGDQPVHALFDTGAETSIISRNLLARSKARILLGKTHDMGSTGALLTTPVAV